MSKRALVLVPLLVLSASCGKSDPPLPCVGDCGTMTAKIVLQDTSGNPIDCDGTQIDRIDLTITTGEGVDVGTRTLGCGEQAELGSATLGVYKLTAIARDAAGAGLGQGSKSTSLVRKDDHKDVEIGLVPGPPSQLGIACDGTCPDGYDCVQIMLGSVTAAFCTAGCGTGTTMMPPNNGDLACRKGYTGVGVPSCQLMAEGASGDVPWSCVLGCGSGQACPTGMSCLSSICIND